MSSRLADIRGEKSLGLFLDRYFYPVLAKEYGFEISEKKRINDKSRQVKGIDVILPMNGRSINIDEKGALRYMMSNLSSFSFEIEFFSDKEDVQKYVDGWFVNKSNLTDYYLIMWVKKSKCDSKRLGRIMAEDYEEVEAYLIEKQSVMRDADETIKAYAKNRNVEDIGEDTYEAYKNLAKWMRDNYTGEPGLIYDCEIFFANDSEKKDNKPGMEKPLDKDHWIRYSPYLPERPINLRISKKRLFELACRRYMITKECVELL